jgi:uncharacterized protein involved in exopolysaccharide biosynthesis/Mrp family chromosome partitioning ATPase
MINERDIIRKEEIDFRRIFNRYIRSWPIIVTCIGLILLLGIIFLLTVPPIFNIKTTIVVDKPFGPTDPTVVVNRMSTIPKMDDFYYNNQKVSFRSLPNVKEALNRLGTISYYKDGLFDKELYKNSPFIVEVDSVFNTFERHKTPFNTTFYVKFIGDNMYSLEAEGEYPVTKEEFAIEDEFKFGDWVQLNDFKFRVLKADVSQNKLIETLNDIENDQYYFVMFDINDLARDYIDAMEIAAEELESSVFGVEMTGSAFQRPIDFLNILGEVFIEKHLDRKREALKNSIDFLNSEMTALNEELERQEEEIEIFKTAHSVTGLKGETVLLFETTVKLENNKVSYLANEQYFSYLKKYLEEKTDFSELISPQVFGIRDELMIKLTEELITLQQDKNRLIEQGNESNPLYKRINDRIEANRSSLIKTVDGFQRNNRMMIDNLDRRIADVDGSMRDIPTLQRQLARMERQYNMNAQLYESLSNRKSEADIALVAIGPDYMIVEPGHLTDFDPIFPTPLLTLIGALTIGFLIGFIIITSKWAFGSGIDDETNAEKHAPSIPSIGSVNFSNIDTPKKLLDYPDSETAQQMGTVFYNLKTASGNKNTFAISSNKEKEGKTYMATMLATKAAMLGYKTLLVDCNIKNPESSRYFQVSMGTNLKEVLQNNYKPAEALQSTGIQNLDFVTVGKDFILNDRVKKVLFDAIDDLKSKYDYIFIDNSPISRVGESVDILNYADFTLLCTRRNATTNDDLITLELLKQKNTLRNCAFVLTESFPVGISLRLLPKKNAYVRNMPKGLMGNIRYILKRI